MKKEDIKLAVFDIDDTLIRRGKLTVENSALLAMNQLKEQGIEVMVATGRAFYFIHDAIHESVKPNFYVTTNGACVYDRNINLIYKTPMNLDETKSLIDYARKNELGIALKMKDNMPVYHDMNIFQTVYMQGSPKQDILEDRTQSSELESAPMGIFMMGDETTIENSRDLAANGFYAKAYTDAYDVYSVDAGKIKGIEFVLSKLNLTWDQVIAFGDAANDMDMIQKAKIGIAMGNSIDILKEKADYVTSDIESDGVYLALKHFNLI